MEFKRKSNIFIQDASEAIGVPMPGLPVFMVEHYGQCAEDLLVAGLMRALAQRLDLDLAHEQYLEIGGNHPVSTSTTFLLHQIFDMRGTIVEANPRLIDALLRGRPHDRVIHTAIATTDAPTVKLSVSQMNELSSLDRRFVLEWDQGRVGEREYIDVPAIRLNNFIECELQGRVPLFMSIDIEGLDLEVLQDLDFGRFRPAIIQAEPSDHHLPQNSLHMMKFMEKVGYRLISKTEVNQIFVDCRLLDVNIEEYQALISSGQQGVHTLLTKSQAEITRLQERVQYLEANLRTKEAALAIANGKQTESDFRLSALNRQIDTLGDERQRYREDLVTAMRHIAALRSSSSWRITAPLRALARVLRN